MNKRQLQLVVAVDEHRNLARAADRLCISAPAVSKSLREIELLLDAELFVRGPRGLVPTTSGLCMVRHARNVLAQLATAAEELHALRTGALGTTMLGVLPAAAPYLAPLGVLRLKEVAPSAGVVLREGTLDALLPELQGGRLQLIAGTVPPPRLCEELAVEVLCADEPIVAVVRTHHQLANREGLRLEDLQGHPWIVPPSGSYPGESLRHMLMRRQLSMPTNIIESGSIIANKTMVQFSNAVGFFSRQIATLYADQQAIRILDLDLGTGVGPVGAMWLRGQEHSPTTRLLLEALRAAAGQTSARTEAVEALH
jgi:DNA-binding transcriptional LysR family regulator